MDDHQQRRHACRARESIGSTNINAGGTVNPGTVGAPLIASTATSLRTTGSTYSWPNSAPQAATKSSATGTAHISTGTTLNLVVDSGTYTVGTKYNILSAAGGLTGTYTTVIVPDDQSEYDLFSERLRCEQSAVDRRFESLLLAYSLRRRTRRRSPRSSIRPVVRPPDCNAMRTAITQLDDAECRSVVQRLESTLTGDIFYPRWPGHDRSDRRPPLRCKLLSTRLATLTGPGAPKVAPQCRSSNGIRLRVETGQ